MSGTIKLQVDSDLDMVRLVARAVRTLCSELLDEESVDAVEISLVEAMNNVIEHGYEGRRGHGVEVQLELQRDHVAIEIVDHAPPMRSGVMEGTSGKALTFDETDIANLPEGGMGLALIRMNMDEVEYCEGAGENRLRMVKKVLSRV